MGALLKQVFISHATEADGEFANRLAQDLDRIDIDVWVAPTSIRPGEQWLDAISRGLETSTHFTLVSTPEAYESSWVRKEYNAALLLEADGAIEIIPLELKKAKVPLFLREFQRISFLGAYDAGLQQLAELLGAGLLGATSRTQDFSGAAEEPPDRGLFLPDVNVRPPASPEPGVFMAYASEDRDYVARLSEYLRSRGVRMWSAPGSIEPGARWDVAITSAIVDASALVVVMTPRAANSAWVARELAVAGREGIPIFPILREGQPLAILDRYQFLDARHDEMPPQQFVDGLKRSQKKS